MPFWINWTCTSPQLYAAGRLARGCQQAAIKNCAGEDAHILSQNFAAIELLHMQLQT